MVRVDWQGAMVFKATAPSGESFFMDSAKGEASKGPSPMSVLLSAVATCTAMDVVSILEKKRQKLTSYRIEVVGHRGPEGVYPRPYTAILVRHILKGKDLDPEAVKRAVQLSDEKYCSVTATLRASPPISTSWEIES